MLAQREEGGIYRTTRQVRVSHGYLYFGGDPSASFEKFAEISGRLQVEQALAIGDEETAYLVGCPDNRTLTELEADLAA